MGRSLAVAVAALVTACGSELGPSRPASVRQGIVGGNVDTASKYGSVYVVKIEHTGGPTAGCTGTLITARTILTAAHCLPPDVTHLYTTNVTPAPASSPTFVESLDWRRHPSWTSSDPSANDIGLILLPAPSTLTPIPYDRTDLTGFTGLPLTAVGYGVTAPGATDNGTRRYVDLTFRGVTAAHIVLGNTTDKGICFGDSGGPSLHTFPDGIARVVGLHSYTQPASSCTDGLDTRVDLYGPFIRTWLTDKEGGGTCFEDGMCKPGCVPADPDCVCTLSDPECPADCVANNVCTSQVCPKPDPDCTCTDTSMCPVPTTCSDGFCLGTNVVAAGPGAPCAQATTFCTGGTVCAGLAVLGPPTCAQPCVLDPDCAATAKICQQGVGGVHYCEREIILVPELTEVSAPGASTGCSASPGALAPLAVALLWWRRRTTRPRDTPPRPTPRSCPTRRVAEAARGWLVRRGSLTKSSPLSARAQALEDRPEPGVGHELDLEVAESVDLRFSVFECHDEISATGMLAPKGQEARGVELLRRALALDRQNLATPIDFEHEVDLMVLLVAPVVQANQAKSRHDFAEDEVLKKLTAVGVSQGVPSAVIGDEAGVEAVDLGLGLDLSSAAAMVRPEHRCQQRRLEDRQVVLHGRARHLARAGE